LLKLPAKEQADALSVSPLVVLRVAVTTSALLTGHSLFVALVDTDKWQPQSIFGEPVIPLGLGLSLVTGVVSLFMVTTQLELGIRPFFVYSNRMMTADDPRLPKAAHDPRSISLSIENVGLGPAVITNIQYTVETKASSGELKTESVADVEAHLRKANLIQGDDYYLGRIGVGSGIAKEKPKVLGEFPSAFQNEVATLKIRLHFKGLLGGQRYKDIDCFGDIRTPR
jgi:hypothetical protein